ncbi:zinc ion binding [Dermatophagoides farinae]|uniref:Zinc ion binding n=1 Tax=Dermatophagoides farinae TaxID=6954 RepID=A0A922HSH5_DERFA|nr:zinc ion binding [Dermatophagoides farinae]
MELSKICGVCGDKALGYNFNALTCESCKAFFRRNALRTKKFHCISGTNDCQLDPKTRKYCRKCRLDKCFAIGMLKEWILTDEEKQLKRRKHRHIEMVDADSSTAHNLQQQQRPIIQSSMINDQSNTINSNNNMNCSTVLDNNNNNQNQNRNKINQGKNNIIIMPILTSSSTMWINNMNNKQEQHPEQQTTTNDDLIKSIDQKRLMEYINERLDLSTSSSNSTMNNGDSDGNQSKDHNNIIFLNENDLIKNKTSDTFTESPSPLFSGNIFDCQQQQQQQPQPQQQQEQQQSSTKFDNLTINDDSTTFMDFQWLPSESLVRNIDTCIHNNYHHRQQSSQQMTTTTTATTLPSYDNENENNSMLPENVIKNQIKYNKWNVSTKVYADVLRMEQIFDGIYDQNPKRLDKMELGRLEELKQIFASLNEMNQRSLNSERKIVNNMEEGFQCLEFAIKQLILHIKNVRAFKNLCLEDQEILLKNSVSKSRCLLNMIRCYNPEQDTVAIPYSKNGTILIFEQDYLRQLHGDLQYEKCRSFCQSFRDDWKNDDMIVNLLIIILVFFPNRNGLLHREYITLEYYTYCHLLQRYLEVKYQSICEARSIYLNLLSRLEEISYFNEELMEMILMKFDPQYIGPLTKELFELEKKT